MPVIDYNNVAAPSTAAKGALWRPNGVMPLVYINVSDVPSSPSWELFGNIDEPWLGWARVNGFSASGHLEGSHGLAMNSNALLTGDPKIEGVSIATTAQADSEIAALLLSMEHAASMQQETLISGVGRDGSLIAVDAGFLFPSKETDYLVTIPLPYYRDSSGQIVSRADQSECKWIVGFGYGKHSNYRPMTDEQFGVWDSALNPVDPTTVLTFKAGRKSSTGMIDVNTSDPLTVFAVGYFIIGVKS